MRWLIHALGGGAGHLTRGYALARRAVADGHQVEILAGGSFSPWLVERLGGQPGLTVTHLDPALGAAAVRAALAARLASIDRMVVDVFPRGLGGELSQLHPRCARVLVLRHLRAGYRLRPA